MATSSHFSQLKAKTRRSLGLLQTPQPWRSGLLAASSSRPKPHLTTRKSSATHVCELGCWKLSPNQNHTRPGTVTGLGATSESWLGQAGDVSALRGIWKEMIQPLERATGIQWVRARFGDSCPVVTSLWDGSQGPPPSVFRPWCHMPPPTWHWGWSPCGQRNTAEGTLYQPGVRLWRTAPSGWCSFPLAFGSLAWGHTSTMSYKPPRQPTERPHREEWWAPGNSQQESPAS